MEVNSTKPGIWLINMKDVSNVKLSFIEILRPLHLRLKPSGCLLPVIVVHVCALEEERFLRDKHAKGLFPLQSSRFCLEFAGLQPDDIDIVAFPYSPISLLSPARWHYARRYWYAPDRALPAIFNGNRRYRHQGQNYG